MDESRVDADLVGKIIKRTWKIIQKIGKGEHSYIYLGFNKREQEFVCIKAEDSKKFSKLHQENLILQILNEDNQCNNQKV